MQTHPDFRFDEGLFHQIGFEGDMAFTKSYLDIRQKEGRLYTDDVVLNLPKIKITSPHLKEWKIRRRSTNRLIRYLNAKQNAQVIEIGCGNGWLVNYLSKSLPFDFCGVDINAVELKQATRLFGSNEKRSFVCADIFSSSFTGFPADVFILAGGVVQYFSNLPALLQRLLKLLMPGGEIHIIDSPFYRNEDLDTAKKRGREHFKETGQSLMQNYYFYHQWELLQSIPYELLYDPSSRYRRLKRLVITDSPFPWIKITKRKLD